MAPCTMTVYMKGDSERGVDGFKVASVFLWSFEPDLNQEPTQGQHTTTYEKQVCMLTRATPQQCVVF